MYIHRYIQKMYFSDAKSLKVSTQKQKQKVYRGPHQALKGLIRSFSPYGAVKSLTTPLRLLQALVNPRKMLNPEKSLRWEGRVGAYPPEK
jgi:hypothetical protein